MKHKTKIGERWYYLIQKDKEVSEASEKVSKIIFGRNKTNLSDSGNLSQNIPTSSSKPIQNPRSQCSSIDSNDENDTDKEYQPNKDILLLCNKKTGHQKKFKKYNICLCLQTKSQLFLEH